MSDRTPVGSLTLNDTDINISLLTFSNPIFISEWVCLSLAKDQWRIVDYQYKIPVDGLLEKMISDYADKHFNKEDFKKNPELTKYFVIEEAVNDEQSN